MTDNWRCPDHNEAGHLEGQCPACNHTLASDNDPSPALRACTCSVSCVACGWSWSHERFQKLRELGNSPEYAAYLEICEEQADTRGGPAQ